MRVLEIAWTEIDDYRIDRHHAVVGGSHRCDTSLDVTLHAVDADRGIDMNDITLVACENRLDRRIDDTRPFMPPPRRRRANDGKPENPIALAPNVWHTDV